jgi:protoheme IX farnesyltransferase
MTAIATKLRLYWPLIKSLQTGLLLMTGAAGYLSAHAPVHWNHFLQMIPSLFFAISGSTILNMWWDRDIDAKMKRTHKRPASAGRVTANEVLRLGFIVSIIGIGWACWVNLLYGLVVFAGLFFDVVIYSIWLKRRTCWAIVWGGISGAMPVLSGRVLAVGGYGELSTGNLGIVDTNIYDPSSGTWTSSATGVWRPSRWRTRTSASRPAT